MVVRSSDRTTLHRLPLPFEQSLNLCGLRFLRFVVARFGSLARSQTHLGFCRSISICCYFCRSIFFAIDGCYKVILTAYCCFVLCRLVLWFFYRWMFDCLLLLSCRLIFFILILLLAAFYPSVLSYRIIVMFNLSVIFNLSVQSAIYPSVQSYPSVSAIFI